MDSVGRDVALSTEPAPDSFWGMLGATERILLHESGVVRRYPAGAPICRQGERMRHVLVVLTGRVQVTAAAASGHEGVLAVRCPGDILGELAAVDDLPRSATVRALDEVAGLTVAATRFAALCQASPRLAWVLLRVVVTRLRDISRQRVDYGATTTGERLARLLTELAAQHGAKAGDGVAITLPLTQQDLAGMVAASRESVVRALHDLRARGFISTARRQITVLQPQALSELAAGVEPVVELP